MTSRPILMSAPMVRAILAGNKTQTRRVVKYAAPDLIDEDGWPLRDMSADGAGEVRSACPYGQPGDRLWVRETWGEFRREPGRPIYRADDPLALGSSNPWKPSIHMPRCYSRITLEITGVRVERLQDISEADAKAEGAPCVDEVSGHEVLFPQHSKAGTYRLGYRALWEQINGPGSWDANPWVWVVCFKRVDS
jgi:hypothetical protein